MVRAADLRVTPTGAAVLRIAVECGAPGERLTLTAVMSGEQAREIAPRLKPGGPVRIAGRLRQAVRNKAEIGRGEFEVIADSIETLDPGRGQRVEQTR